MSSKMALKIEIKRGFVIFLVALFCILIERPEVLPGSPNAMIKNKTRSLTEGANNARDKTRSLTDTQQPGSPSTFHVPESGQNAMEPASGLAMTSQTIRGSPTQQSNVYLSP